MEVRSSELVERDTDAELLDEEIGMFTPTINNLLIKYLLIIDKHSSSSNKHIFQLKVCLCILRGSKLQFC